MLAMARRQISYIRIQTFIIHVSFEHEIILSIWLLMCVYSPLYTNLKNSFWAKLNIMAESINEPWALIGDFNEIMNLNEK